MDVKTRKRAPEQNVRARSLRYGDNMAEALLWSELKAHKLDGFKFVRQFPIGPYFADFLCREQRLVVEVDGAQHSDSAYDARRDKFMCAEGYSVIRFWNTGVIKDRAGVLRGIHAALVGEFADVIVSPSLRFFPWKAGLR